MRIPRLAWAFAAWPLLTATHVLAQEEMSGLRGDPAAIADLEGMVDAMGGAEIWSQLQSLHFRHRWWPHSRVDSYVENEFIDLSGPRSRADRVSEINSLTRAYSPEHGYWRLDNGVLTRGSNQSLQSSLERAPFNFFHLIKAVAAGDPFYEVQFGPGDIPGSRRIDFSGPDGVVRGWVILNARKEPIVKATNEYRYILGPLQPFGNLRVPGWGVYDNGYTRYEMISLEGSNQPFEISIFAPPTETDGSE